jgi:hypothetical protein
MLDMPPAQSMRLGVSLVWQGVVEWLRSGRVHVHLETTDDTGDDR